ncbi:hypothetical protein N7491_009950 [Penicillium cf. griseofulvum]|uniref:Uncharacterized protein n=1 Tax=Penicillium cf. griseofulvum TaxID=2972120 RepID=A0A9W9MZ76_9EURO|nr:hypothetical protein N7472_000281 [Penicillium cf. griseofulvum]KAJ5421505.1 hypothetical protein N7491_009950 [Penicillium cf. griseofulvum]
MSKQRVFSGGHDGKRDGSTVRVTELTVRTIEAQLTGTIDPLHQPAKWPSSNSAIASSLV